MHVLYTARVADPVLEENWQRLGIASTFISHDYVIEVLSDPLRRGTLWADAVVVFSDHFGRLPEQYRPKAGESLRPAAAVALSVRFRRMDDSVAMSDGRKWNALPIVVLTMTDLDHAEAAGAVATATLMGISRIEVAGLLDVKSSGGEVIRSTIKKYRQDMLNELDNLGFVVRYEGGRYRLGPALKTRGELTGHYYFGPADQRRSEFVTIDRDLSAIQLETEMFEALINREDVTEGSLQRFFEEYPHFLSQLAMPLPHVQLHDTAGRLLIPDFILKPLVAMQRDSRWEVLDLKRPQASIIVGKGARRRFSHEVMEAIRQLRDYGDYFADPRNATSVRAALGHQLQRPKLAVLIGRLLEPNVEALEMEQARLPDVRIVTYDEILAQQRTLI